MWRVICRRNLQDPGGTLHRASQGVLPYTSAQPTHGSSAQLSPIPHNREGGPGPIQVSQGVYLN